MSRVEIDALNAQFVRFLEEGDVAGMVTLYTPGARVMPPNAPTATGDAIRDLWATFIGMGVDGGALKTHSLEEHGDVAIEVGEYEMRVGATLADVGKYVVVHRRQPDGGWKMDIDIFNSDRAPETA